MNLKLQVKVLLFTWFAIATALSAQPASAPQFTGNWYAQEKQEAATAKRATPEGAAHVDGKSSVRDKSTKPEPALPNVTPEDMLAIRSLQVELMEAAATFKQASDEYAKARDEMEKYRVAVNEAVTKAVKGAGLNPNEYQLVEVPGPAGQAKALKFQKIPPPPAAAAKPAPEKK